MLVPGISGRRQWWSCTCEGGRLGGCTCEAGACAGEQCPMNFEQDFKWLWSCLCKCGYVSDTDMDFTQYNETAWPILECVDFYG